MDSIETDILNAIGELQSVSLNCKALVDGYSLYLQHDRQFRKRLRDALRWVAYQKFLAEIAGDINLKVKLYGTGQHIYNALSDGQ